MPLLRACKKNPFSSYGRIFTFVAFAFFVASIVLHPHSPLHTHVLSDPDDYMRLNEVINWLQSASIADIQAENYPGPKPTSLLYKILRQSMLLLYANLAGNNEVKAGRLTVAQIQESQLVDIQASTTNLTPWQVLVRPSIPNPHLTWADYLLTANFPPNTPFAQLNDVRASLGRLAARPTAELDRLLTETLDACSHRLDVWATTIATSLLKRTRAQNNAVYLGCYGWVENVKPETGRIAVQGTELQQVQAFDVARWMFEGVSQYDAIVRSYLAREAA